MWKAFEPRILSRLGKLYQAKTHEKIISLVDQYSLDDNEFYFDRDPGSFNCILNYHRWVNLSYQNIKRNFNVFDCFSTGLESSTVLMKYVPWTTQMTSSSG